MDPITIEDHRTKVAENTKVENGTVHLCCPFCAAPDFFVYPDSIDRTVELNELLAKGATCKECERSAKVVFDNGPKMFQTGGSPPADYLIIPRQT